MDAVQHDALLGGGQVVYVADIVPADGAGNPWLAVGYLVDGGGARYPSAWTSPDAVSWRRSAMPPTGSSEQRDGPFHVARRGGVAVAIGNRFDGQFRAAAWWSSAPGVWNAVPLTDPLVAFDGDVNALAAGPTGFIAVGMKDDGFGSTVTAFHSADGRAWTVHSEFRRPVVDGFFPLGVSVTSDRIVVVGDNANNQDVDGRIWTYARGWHRVDPASIGLGGTGLQQVAGVAWDPTLGFVAGGVITGGVEVPTVWTSPDGLAWTRVPDGSAMVATAPAAIHEVVAVAGGFLAVANSGAGPRLWRTANGRDWTVIATPSLPRSDGALLEVASTGTTTALLFLTQTGSRLFRRTSADWTRADTGDAFPRPSPVAAELRDVAVAGRRVVAVGNDGQERPLVMVSTGGASWRKAPFADRSARLVAISSQKGTFHIVGWRLVKGVARLAAWTSRAGTSWRLVGGTAFEPVGVFADVTQGPSGLVAVAFEPSRRGFVTSVWALTSRGWRSSAVVGAGLARAICTGPDGTTAVATTGTSPQSTVVAWTRRGDGRWPREPEVVATRSTAERCADGPNGTVIVGSSASGAAVTWRRTRGGAWRATVIAQTGPPSAVLDVARLGSGFLATGTSGERGQSDLAVWESSDGAQWNRTGGTDPVFFDPGYQAGVGLARLGPLVIVVGRHGAGNAGLWVGDPSGATMPGPVRQRRGTGAVGFGRGVAAGTAWDPFRTVEPPFQRALRWS